MIIVFILMVILLNFVFDSLITAIKIGFMLLAIYVGYQMFILGVPFDVVKTNLFSFGNLIISKGQETIQIGKDALEKTSELQNSNVSNQITNIFNTIKETVKQ